MEPASQRFLNQLEPTERTKEWTLAELYNATLPPVEGALLDHLFTPYAVSLILGDFNVGKTWLILSLASAIARGRHWGHMNTAQRRVILFSEEMVPSELQPRLRKLFSPREILELDQQLIPRFQSSFRLEEKDECARMANMIAKANANLAIVDAFSDIHQKEENSNTDMKLVWTNARDLIARPTSSHIVFVHHTSKPNEFRRGAHRGRGAIVMLDVAADALLVDRGEHNQRIVTFEKVRHGKIPPPFSYQINNDPDDDSKVIFEIEQREEIEQSMLSDVKKLCDWIAQTGPKDIKAITKRFKWSERTAKRHTSQGITCGRLENLQPAGHRAIYQLRPQETTEINYGQDTTDPHEAPGSNVTHDTLSSTQEDEP